jgi:hypothetical protein
MTERVLIYSSPCSFAWAVSESRKSGWAIAIRAFARSRMLLPRSSAAPY